MSGEDKRCTGIQPIAGILDYCEKERYTTSLRILFLLGLISDRPLIRTSNNNWLTSANSRMCKTVFASLTFRAFPLVNTLTTRVIIPKIFFFFPDLVFSLKQEYQNLFHKGNVYNYHIL